MIASSPEAIHFFSCVFDTLVGSSEFTFDGYFRHSLPPMKPICSGRCPKSCTKVLNCCFARTSVGAR